MSARKSQWFWSLLLLAAGAAAVFLLVASGPEANKGEPEVRITPVETVAAERSIQRFRIGAQGVVKPAVEVTLQPQVAGRIIAIHPSLSAGGTIAEGEVLLQIEKADYELAEARDRTALAEAQAQLELEKGRQRVAQREWTLFEGELGDAERDSSLALREPQLRVAEAAVAAAEARLRQSQLNLERTTMRAPFNAYVVDESVDVGQTVGTQSPVARLVGTQHFWVQTSLPAQHLSLLAMPGYGGENAPVSVHYDFGDGRTTWTGRVVRVLGNVNVSGQMAQVLVAIDDPLSLTAETRRPPLLLGSFVDVDMYSQSEHSVFVLPRELVYPGDQVYVFAQDQLEIRRVQVAWRETNWIYISDGLDAGDAVISSPVAAPVQGMPLQQVSEDVLTSQAATR